MLVEIRRDTYTDSSTQGELWIDGEFFCHTLEPRKDQSNGKPFCVPPGTYVAGIVRSPRFGIDTPHIDGIPEFSDIEIHPGNYPQDTEGCCLVGNTKESDFVGESRDAFNALMAKLRTATDPITVTYTG